MGIGVMFFNISPQTRETKVKINTGDQNKLKAFHNEVNLTIKSESMPIEWEKIFSNNIFDKRLVSKNSNNSHNS